MKEGFFDNNVYKGKQMEVYSPSQNDMMRSTRASSNFYGKTYDQANGI